MSLCFSNRTDTVCGTLQARGLYNIREADACTAIDAAAMAAATGSG